MQSQTTTESMIRTMTVAALNTPDDQTGVKKNDDTNQHAVQLAPIGLNALRVINARYARKDEQGTAQEAWNQIVERTVNAVAQAEERAEERELFVNQMREIMLRREFIPNTPCLVNAGKPDPQLAACFVLPVEDSIEGIMKHASAVAKIHQTGGGTGQSYEFLRPAGAMVNSTKGEASGPVSFMQIVNTATDVVKQGGVRRGANMGCLRVNHPDILRFIHAKNDQTSLTNFNISVTVTDKFMEAVENEEWFQLEFDGKPWDQPIFDPVTGEDYQTFYDKNSDLISFCDRQDYLARQNEIDGAYQPCSFARGKDEPGMVYAPDVWNRITLAAHKYAEPGVIFIDEVNRHNLLKNSMGEIYSCNPCAEEMLHSMNACNLGSIDVSKFFEANSGKLYQIDWEKLENVISWSVRFLDNVIDVCHWPLPEIDETVKRTRPIGLGIMGFADLCLKLKVRYGSDESLKLMDVVMRFFRRGAWQASLRLGQEKGPFPEFKANLDLYKGFFNGEEMKPFRPDFPLLPRNYEVTTIAPTGTISLVAETSSGIEPNFSWAFVRADTVGTRTSVHPLAAEALGLVVDFGDEQSMKRAAEFIVENQHLLPDYFVTAMDLTAEEHVRMLGAAQRHVDNSISKTCNGKADDTVESVDQLYRLARELGCKAVSYYRDGSRDHQVLTTIVKTETAESSNLSAEIEQAAVQPVPSADSIASGIVQPARTEVHEPRRHQKVERPRELEGSTWSFNFAENKLYVTVNHNREIVLEVFVAGSISNGVGVLASTMLQSDCFTTEDVARKLDKITGTNSVWFNERLLTSPEQAVAECLRIVARRLKNVPEGNHSSQTADLAKPLKTQPAEYYSKSVEFKVCPKCKEQALLTIGGCPTCQECGYSKCS